MRRLLPMSIYATLKPEALKVPSLTYGQTAKARAVIEADRKRKAAQRRAR